MEILGSSQNLFHVSSEQHGHTVRLRLSGELDLATLPALDEWLSLAESNGNTAIVLDLERLTFIDASGLGAFLRAAGRARQSGRTFSIVKAPAVVRKVLQITRTNHLFGADRPSFSSDRQLVATVNRNKA